MEIVRVSSWWASSTIWFRSAKTVTERTHYGLSELVRVRKCSISLCFLSPKEPSEKSAWMVSRNFQDIKTVFPGFGLPWMQELFRLPTSESEHCIDYDESGLRVKWQKMRAAQRYATVLKGYATVLIFLAMFLNWGCMCWPFHGISTALDNYNLPIAKAFDPSAFSLHCRVVLATSKENSSQSKK